MLDIFKVKARYFLAPTLFFFILLSLATNASAASYKNHNCEACSYQYRIDAEADYVKCPACGYESDVDQSGSSNQSQKPLSTNKQLKNSLKEAKNELIGEAIDSLSKAIVGSPSGSGGQPSGMSQNRAQPTNSRNFGAGVAQSGNGRSVKSMSNDLECSKCGHSAAFFPYADSSKKLLKCPSCGKTQKLR